MRFVGAKWALLPVVVAALVACGGGGTEGGETMTVSGVVAKGPAKGAKVSIYAADGTTKLAGPVITGDGGAYTVKLDAKQGPFLVVADLEGADIEDETAPGTTYKGAAGQTLRAVAQDLSSSVQLTPFSDMAADLALEFAAGGSLSADAVTDANRKIRQILNNTDFLTADPTSGEMLAKLTAVQTLVKDKGLTAVLEQLRDAASSGEGGLTVTQSFVTALQEACSGDGCSNAFNPVVASTPLPVGESSGIDTVKALFQDLRDTYLSYSNDAGTGGLDQSGVKIADALAAAVQPIDDEQIKSLAMVVDADEMLRAFKAGTSTQRRLISSGGAYGQVVTRQADGTVVGPGWLPQFGCEVAKATIVSKAEGLDVGSDYTAADADVTPGNANVVACYGVGTVGRLYPGVGDGYGYYHSLLLIPQGGNSYKYVHQLRKGRYDRTLEPLTSRVRAVYGSMSVTRDADGFMSGAVINGKLIPGFKGHAAGEFDTLDRVDANLNIATSSTATTSSVNVSGSLVLVKTNGTQASRVDITSGSFAAKLMDETYSYSYEDFEYVGAGGACSTGYTTATWSTDYCSKMVTESYTETVTNLGSMTLDVSVAAPGVKFQGIATAGSAMYDKSAVAYMPTVMSLQGKLYEADGAGYRVLLDGLAKVQLVDFGNFDASSGMLSPMKASFDGKVLLKSRPAMGFTFAAERDTTAVNAASGTFFWNNKTLTFTGDVAGNLMVRNDDGVRFTIPRNGSRSYQAVYKGAVKVGEINLDLARINYADGTYQQY